LLGEKVRYDGGHKVDRFLTDTLGQYVEYVPVCPEAECGFGIPRETLRLEGDPDTPRLVTTCTKKDYTGPMVRWAQQRVVELEKEGLCGFIFKSNSPSSGMERVKVYNAKGMPVKKGIGIFARIFMEHFPLIPVEDDGRLQNPTLRENFIERIFTMKLWRENVAKKWSVGNLVNFHTRHKLLILSHSNKHYRGMGKIVARGKSMPIEELYKTYEALLLEALELKTTPRKNLHVLQHSMGYFKKELSSDEKEKLLEVFAQYRNERVPLIVPITLVNHYVRKYKQPYLSEQTYLRPHPISLGLRNHV